MEDWKCIYSTDQMYKAEMMKAFLVKENIEAVVVNKKDSAYTVFAEVELYVQPEDEHLAIELIKEIKIE